MILPAATFVSTGQHCIRTVKSDKTHPFVNVVEADFNAAAREKGLQSALVPMDVYLFHQAITWRDSQPLGMTPAIPLKLAKLWQMAPGPDERRAHGFK